MGRLNSPLPDEVFDRYYAEHPGETDHRKVSPLASKKDDKPREGESMDQYLARRRET